MTPSKLDLSLPVRTKDGRAAHFLDVPIRSAWPDFPLLFRIVNRCGDLYDLENYALDGTARRGPPKNNLVNVLPPFDPAQPAWTVDGRKAELTSSSPLAMEYPLTFMVRDPDGRKRPAAYTRDGKGRRSPSPLDLTNTRPR